MEIIGLLAFFALLLVIVLGVPISIAMGFLGLAFGIALLGFSSAASMAASSAWYNMAHFTIAMIPLFVLMGTIVAAAGIGRDAYECFYRWLGRVRGSIAIVNTVTCGLFAAATGSSTATVATIGSISIPEMKRLGYDKSLSLGSLAAAGTLGILIPPSIAMVFIGVLTEMSIGQLFVGGIVPGLITILLFSGMIFVKVSINPSLAPIPEVKFTLKEKVQSTRNVIPIVLIFLIVIIGIYRGFFDPTEAAAIGALSVAIIALVMKRLTWSRFKWAINESLRITGFIMLIIMGAMLFAKCIALSGLSLQLANMVAGLDVPRYLIIAAMVAVYIGLGCVLDTFGLMVLTVPLFYEMVLLLGYDPIWFGVLVVVLVEIALITPPIGTNIYVAKSLDPEASSVDVIKGIVPFFFMELVLIVLLVAFPQIILWLPSTMIR